jgi:hypothetical protein
MTGFVWLVGLIGFSRLKRPIWREVHYILGITGCIRDHFVLGQINDAGVTQYARVIFKLNSYYTKKNILLNVIGKWYGEDSPIIVLLYSIERLEVSIYNNLVVYLPVSSMISLFFLSCIISVVRTVSFTETQAPM